MAKVFCNSLHIFHDYMLTESEGDTKPDKTRERGYFDMVKRLTIGLGLVLTSLCFRFNGAVST